MSTEKITNQIVKIRISEQFVIPPSMEDEFPRAGKTDIIELYEDRIVTYNKKYKSTKQFDKTVFHVDKREMMVFFGEVYVFLRTADECCKR